MVGEVFGCDGFEGSCSDVKSYVCYFYAFLFYFSDQFIREVEAGCGGGYGAGLAGVYGLVAGQVRLGGFFVW